MTSTTAIRASIGFIAVITIATFSLPLVEYVVASGAAVLLSIGLDLCGAALLYYMWKRAKR